MSPEAQLAARERVRTYLTGACDGSDVLLAALAAHPEIELVGVSEGVQEAADALSRGRVQAVVHATRSPSLLSRDVAVLREHTQAALLVAATGESAQLLEEALQADVADVLLLPQLSENVVFAIRKATHGSRRPAERPAEQGRIVTVFSPKGGTGKTVVSMNLAAALAKHERKRTLLLDLDLQFGDASIMLGVEPEKTIYDLVVAPGELDSEKLAGYTTRHESGFEILPAPLHPEDAELVTETRLAQLLEVARAAYDFVVIDTSPFFHGPLLAALDRTDEILLLCQLDVPTVKNVRLSLRTLELLSFPRSRIRVVLNRANLKVGISQQEVEDALELKMRHTLPSTRAVPLTINRGTPTVLAQPRDDFSKAVRALAKSLVATPAAKPQRRGPFRGLRR